MSDIKRQYTFDLWAIPEYMRRVNRLWYQLALANASRGLPAFGFKIGRLHTATMCKICGHRHGLGNKN